MLHEEITKDVIGAAMIVLNSLKPGLDEKLYENALKIELQERGHAIEQQQEFPVHDRGQFVGSLMRSRRPVGGGIHEIVRRLQIDAAM